MEKRYMNEAIRLAYTGMESNRGGPFGAVVVKGSKVIGRGYNTVTSTNDPTAHAEINAIRDACNNIGGYSLEGCIIYASSEPCPMCLGAIYWARIEKVYYGCSKTDAAEAGFIDAHLYQEFKLENHLKKISIIEFMREEAREVFNSWKKKEDKAEY